MTAKEYRPQCWRTESGKPEMYSLKKNGGHRMNVTIIHGPEEERMARIISQFAVALMGGQKRCTVRKAPQREITFGQMMNACDAVPGEPGAVEGGQGVSIHPYPEMNSMIKDLLRRSNEPMKQYILARIEQLEAENATLRGECHDR